MMQRRGAGLIAFLLAVVCGLSSARAQSPQQTLQQYVADLQSNPSDNALRQKIIALSQTMNPPPAIPEEAREHYVMATTFMESAKDATGFARAVEQYKAALLVAPWWADAYKKLAIAQKAAAQYDDAIVSLNFYLASQPSDARDAQDEIYKLKALKQAAADEAQRRAEEERARENSPEVRAEKERNDFAELLRKINGRKYTAEKTINGSPVESFTIYVEGNHLRGTWSILNANQSGTIDVEAQGKVTTFTGDSPVTNKPWITWHSVTTYTISDDGNNITYRIEISGSDGYHFRDEIVYSWQQ